MEIWLRQANNTFRFPVIPPSFEINGSATINTSNILSVGDIAVFGGLGLKTIELSSFSLIKNIVSVIIMDFQNHMIV